VIKTPPPKKEDKTETRIVKTMIAMTTEQALALKNHLESVRDGLSKEDQQEFNMGPLGKILSIL
jgi:hypothetical protein